MTICLFLFQKVNCGPVRRGRRTTGLKVAMTFPAKKTGKRPASEPLPQNKVQDSESEEEENFIVKRALNIKENKEMVLFDVCFLLYHCCWSWTLTADRFWHLFTSLSFSLQSLWQSWTKSPDSSPDEWRCLHPLRYLWRKSTVCFLLHVCCRAIITGTISTATPDTSAVHGSPQEDLATFLPASHTVPHPGGGTPQPNSRGRAWGQVQPGPQKPLLWGIWWASKSDD